MSVVDLLLFFVKSLHEDMICDSYCSSQPKKKKERKRVSLNVFRAHAQKQILSAWNFCEKYINGKYKY